MRSGFVVVMSALLACVCTAALAQPTGLPPAKVRVATVIEKPVEQKRRVTGEIRPMRRSQLAAEEAGLVSELTVDAGSSVSEGEVIARLDSSRMELQLVEARAGIPAAEALISEREADAAQADRDLERVREVLSRESGSAPELDRAARDAAVARARLAQAQAQLAVAKATVAVVEQRLEDLVIRAPFDGRVVEKLTEVGQWVSAGDAVIDLVEIAEVEIRVDVPEAFIERASKAKTVSVMVPALNLELEARVLAVVPQADPRTRLFPVRLVASNPEGAIRPGMSAIGLMPTSQEAMTTLVPKDAILQSETGSHVFIDREGMAAMVSVERLFAVGDLVAVRSTMLSAGMRVVVEGNERLIPSQPLMILGGQASQTEPAPEAK